MIKKDQKQLFEEIYHLQNCEMAMGQLYQQAADNFPEERIFWMEAICDEVDHARRIGHLLATINSRPGRFSLGKYRVAVLETFLNGVYDHIEQIRKGELSHAQVLKIIVDYESSILMSRPYDIVESMEIDFREFKKSFAEAVMEHGARIKQYVNAKLGMVNIA